LLAAIDPDKGLGLNGFSASSGYLFGENC